MKPETLQSLSVGLVFIGLLVAALGGFGALHFGHLAQQEQEDRRTVVVQGLVEIVGALQDGQRGLHERVATVEKKATEPAPAPVTSQIASFLSIPPPPVISGSANPAPPPPPSSLAASGPAAPATEPPPQLPMAPPVPGPAPDLLLPHLPAIAQGPPGAAETEPPPAALKPPRLPLASARTQAPETAVHEEAGTLSGLRRARLVKRLHGHAQQGVVIRAAAENPKAVKLAITLKSIFREAGWTVDEIEMVNQSLPAHTLLLSTGVFPPPKEFVAAYAALAGVGFLVTSDLDPDQKWQRVVVSVGPLP